jgi:putative oxidoreductase
MLVAILTVHKGHGFFAMSNGVELPVLYITGALAVAFAGPGLYSLDHLLGLDTAIPPVATWIALTVGVAGAFGNLAARHAPEPATKSA